MIRTIVVDDEQPSLRKLEKQLTCSGVVEVVAIFTEPEEALAFLKAHKIDAVFLDIEMPEIDGIELATRIADLQPDISVVFVTAYNQYAVEAFRLNALDYLLKPVTEERLRLTLGRLQKAAGPAEKPDELSVRCFGNFCVTAGASDVKFRTEKAAELLAFLLDCRGAYIGRSKIIDSLWEDFDGDRAIMHFNTTLYNVKKALQGYGFQLSVVFNQGSYRLEPTEISSDYLRFCALIDKSKTIKSDTIGAFEEAATLYSGEYLSGWDYPWVIGKRLLLLEQYIGLILKLAVYYKSIGDTRKVVQWLQTGLEQEPLHREMNLRLIETLLSTHEKGLADKYYNFYCEGLRKKLDQEPDDDFRYACRKL